MIRLHRVVDDAEVFSRATIRPGHGAPNGGVDALRSQTPERRPQRDEHGMARAVRWTRAMRDVRSPRARLPARATPPATPSRQGPQLELTGHDLPAIDEEHHIAFCSPGPRKFLCHASTSPLASLRLSV